MQAISNMYEYLKKNIYKSSKKIYKKIKGVKRKTERTNIQLTIHFNGKFIRSSF